MNITEAIQVGTLAAVALGAFFNRMEARRSAKVQDKIHTLVNSQMSVQLRVNMLQAKRIAELTKLPSDIELATESERLYNEQVRKQELADKTKP